MTDTRYTPEAMLTMSDALPKLRGHMPDCGCSHCGQMIRVAAMLRQGAQDAERWTKLKGWHRDEASVQEGTSVDGVNATMDAHEAALDKMTRLEREP